jgi:hypothetical protein
LRSNSRAAIAHALRASHSVGSPWVEHTRHILFVWLSCQHKWNATLHGTKLSQTRKKSNPTFLSWRDCHFGYVGYNCPDQ